MGYLFATVSLMVYGQLVLKWRIGFVETALPDNLPAKLLFLGKMLLDPWVMSGFCAAFLASLFWMAAISKLELSYAYPFMSLAFVLVLFLSAVFFHESINWQKLVGMGLIVAGIVVSSQG
jgi:multidrug transporter EmrE-like cation transporter